MKTDALKSDLILLLVATIWGLAFVAQRIGMEHIGPFTFNGLRFTLGCISLLPLLIFGKKNPLPGANQGLLLSGIISGVILFCAISLQQVGIVYTTAGKAGFITGLYVIFVPFLNLLFKQEETSKGTWVGAILATIGMSLLSLTNDFRIGYGDFLVLLCAIGFSFHLIVIGRFSNRYNTVKLAFVQFLVCALLSLLFASILETFVIEDIQKVYLPLFYGGVMSVGIAYSLQIYGQKKSPAAHAAIIFSMESVVAAIGGWVILREILSGRAIVGCALMLSGMLISQLYKKKI